MRRQETSRARHYAPGTHGINRAFTVSCALLFAAVLGCSSGTQAPTGDATPQAPPKEGKRLTIGVMPKLVGIDYFNATEQGAREAAKELGVVVDFDGPVTNDVTQQAQLVETWITKKYDAICVAPNDPSAISVVLKRARNAGIPVLTWDADALPEARDFFVNQASPEAIARILMDTMAEAVGPTARYVIITGSLTAANQNIWMEHMERYRREKYPNMVNLSPTPKASEEDQALATQVVIDCLKAYPDLQGIFAITAVAFPGAAEALRKTNTYDKVFLTGLATPNSMREYIKSGVVRKDILWNPVDLGYLTVYAAVAAARGELKPTQTEFTAGRLGTVKIKDREILLGEPLIFDKDNIDQYNF